MGWSGRGADVDFITSLINILGRWIDVAFIKPWNNVHVRRRVFSDLKDVFILKGKLVFKTKPLRKFAVAIFRIRKTFYNYEQQKLMFKS